MLLFRYSSSACETHKLSNIHYPVCAGIFAKSPACWGTICLLQQQHEGVLLQLQGNLNLRLSCNHSAPVKAAHWLCARFADCRPIEISRTHRGPPGLLAAEMKSSFTRSPAHLGFKRKRIRKRSRTSDSSHNRLPLKEFFLVYVHLLPRSATICQINSINFLKQLLLLFTRNCCAHL